MPAPGFGELDRIDAGRIADEGSAGGETIEKASLAIVARLKDAHSPRSYRVAGNETISEGAPFEVNDETVDPEEQETVMFGQRSLFHDVEIAVAAKRQAEARSRRGDRRKEPLDDVSDTVVTAPAALATREVAAPPSASSSKGRAAKAADDLDGPAGDVAWIDSVEVEPQTIELSGPTPSSTSVGGGATPPQDEASLLETVVAKSSSAKAEREVAERRPTEKRRGRESAASESSCSCRMCGRGVRWPKARRFRGAKQGHHGFRCDTCGNVFCAEHVVRVSRFWESLLHHGRFRCLLCELGNMAKQAEQLRARQTSTSRSA